MATDGEKETVIEEAGIVGEPLGGASQAFSGAGLGDRPEVSASTIGRMMGLATVSEMKLLESKIDILATKLNGMTLKLEKFSQSLSNVPQGSDLERIDVQIGALRSMLKDFLAGKSIAEQHPSEHGSTDQEAVKDFIRSNMTDAEKERAAAEAAEAAEAEAAEEAKEDSAE